MPCLDPDVLLSEENTLELMRCLSDITVPVQKSGKDLYGNLEGLSHIAGNTAGETAISNNAHRDGEDGSEKERMGAALRQLDVVRYALAQNLSKCYVRQ